MHLGHSDLTPDRSSVLPFPCPRRVLTADRPCGRAAPTGTPALGLASSRSAVCHPACASSFSACGEIASRRANPSRRAGGAFMALCGESLQLRGRGPRSGGPFGLHRFRLPRAACTKGPPARLNVRSNTSTWGPCLLCRLAKGRASESCHICT